MTYYSPLSRRIKAMLFDSLIFGLVVICSISLFAFMGVGKWEYTGIVFMVFLVSLEPFFIAFTGSSIGQHFYNIEVKNIKTGLRLGLIRSYIRFLIKIPMGILSLITVLSSKYHQGIHDLATNSIVVHRNTEKIPVTERLTTRVIDDQYKYPSYFKRVIFIFIYQFISLIFLTIVLLSFLSDGCLSNDNCTKKDNILDLAIGVMLYLSIFSIIALGWSGRLYGCRKKLIQA